LFFGQLRALAAARDVEVTISSYRTEHGAEVDFIVEPNNIPWAIECKASHQVGRSDLRGLASFAEHIKRKHRAVIAYLGSVPRIIDGVEVLPWQSLLAELDAAIA
jgi:predicted AAA+ superfamily ATPase